MCQEEWVIALQTTCGPQGTALGLGGGRGLQRRQFRKADSQSHPNLEGPAQEADA